MLMSFVSLPNEIKIQQIFHDSYFLHFLDDHAQQMQQISYFDGRIIMS